ncbi:zinc finger protein 814-like [Malaya genurostris]|uniref:zinc finger protein 814-like n=1 Tax=Malaya genurostris TaxID=325434 RepID=UPI0026F37DD6|nr:zinc finger protein 814-like [Malaya genurostris]
MDNITMYLRCCLCLRSGKVKLTSVSCMVLSQKKTLSDMLSASLGSVFNDNNRPSKHVCSPCLHQANRLYLTWKRASLSHIHQRCTKGEEHNYLSCRLCKRNDTDELIEMSCPGERWKVSIDEQLKFLGGALRKERDGLPPYVCISCLADLEEAYGFKNQCINATLKSWQKMKFQSSDSYDLVIDLHAEIVPLVGDEANSGAAFLPRKSACSVCNYEFNTEQCKPECSGCLLNFSNYNLICQYLTQKKTKEYDEVHSSEAMDDVDSDALEKSVADEDDNENDDDDDSWDDGNRKGVGKSTENRKCPDIDTLFEVIDEEFEKHYQQIKRKGPICCGCNRFFLTKAEVEEHRKKEHTKPTGTGDYNCKLCLKRFQNAASYSAHNNKLTKLVYDFCKTCQILFLTDAGFMRHKVASHRKHTSQKQASGQYTEEVTILYQCCVPTCRNQYASNEEQLLQHYNVVHNEIEMLNQHNTCAYCGLSFKNEQDCEEHNDRRKECVRYRCIKDSCTFTVTKLSEIIAHCSEKRHRQYGSSKRWKHSIPDFKHFDLIGKVDDITDILQRKSEACCGCSLFFESAEDLRKHCKEKHAQIEDKYQFHCSDCGKGFDRDVGLSAHLYSAANRTHYYCHACRIFMWRKSDMTFHKAYYHTEEQKEELDGCYDIEIEDCFTCCGCDKQFQHQEDLAKHRLSKHTWSRKRKPKLQDVRCGNCDKFFSNPERLRQHQEMYESRTIYLCQEALCAFRTREFSSMLRHVSSSSHRTAEGRKFFVAKGQQDEYRCCGHLCDFVDSSYDNIIEHFSNCHAEKRDRNIDFYGKSDLSCPACMKGFDDPITLANHQFAKRKPKPVKSCRICKKSFKRDEYRSHFEQCSRKTVTSIKRPKANTPREVCSICGKYLSKTAMVQHRLAHENKRAWKCKLCPLRFNTETLLWNHRVVHSGEKMYKCREGCSNRYKNPGDRTRHEKLVHLGITPFACLVCPESFVRKRDLQLHERKHTGRLLYPCDSCEDSFNKYSEFKLHKETCTENQIWKDEN